MEIDPTVMRTEQLYNFASGRLRSRATLKENWKRHRSGSDTRGPQGIEHCIVLKLHSWWADSTSAGGGPHKIVALEDRN